MKHYHLTYNYSLPFPPGTALASQVQALRDVDLYIIVHGGGAINSIFLPPHATIIEIFPYGMKNPVYENIALNLGLFPLPFPLSPSFKSSFLSFYFYIPPVHFLHSLPSELSFLDLSTYSN